MVMLVTFGNTLIKLPLKRQVLVFRTNLPCCSQKLRVWFSHHGLVFLRIVQIVQEVLHAIESAAFLVIRSDDVPGSISRICVEKHDFPGFAIVFPLGKRCEINRAEFPLFPRVSFS